MTATKLDLGERGLERAETFERLSNEATVRRIQSSLGSSGEEFCVSCGERIDAARRVALPSARRCVGCQSAHERALRERR